MNDNWIENQLGAPPLGASGPVVLGVDPSLTASAVASTAGWVEVAGLDGHRDDGYPRRLARIAAVAVQVTQLIKPLSTSLVVLEGPAPSRGAMPSAFDRAGLWWRIYSYCIVHGIPVAVCPPNIRAMYATGVGNAGKGAVIDQVARRWPTWLTKGDDNAADAVTLMALGADWCGHPLTDMPKTHRRALDRVAWPEMGPS